MIIIIEKNQKVVLLITKIFPGKKRTKTFENISKVRALVLKDNQATQRTVARSIKSSVRSTGNIIVNTHLNLKKDKKKNQWLMSSFKVHN